MNEINNLVENKLYRDFAGLPNGRAIVRNNIPQDAFTVAILKVMYGKNYDFEITPENVDKISRIIVAPPDSGIDMFVEIEDGDEYYYDVIQAKYADLSEADLRVCFLQMKDSIKKYLKNPDKVEPRLRDVIAETNFSSAFKHNCTYYVYHTGTLNYGRDFKTDEKIITLNEMEVVYNSVGDRNHTLKVPYAEFTSDMFNNYILYENSSDNAMLCNIRGYDLAELCNKYMSSSMGRNILFGQNLRDSLDQKKSKTYSAMMSTIKNEPERFWNYNNGITILCEELDAKRKGRNGNVDVIQITNFSIINGAQTTNALGSFLRKALMENSAEDIEQLKKVYVLVRIMQVNNATLSGNISIYNNLQNPISTRDMVANNYEQIELQNMLMTGEAPYIYVEIRRGQNVPAQPRFEKHQRITNEELAQLAFAAFLNEPYTAKDKKKSLFNKDGLDSSYLLNPYYDKVFYLAEDQDQKGVLFQKSKEEIDEALFIKHLYIQARNRMKRIYDENIAKCYQRIEINPVVQNQQQKMIALYQRNKDVNNTCMFFCIALYFTLKENFGDIGEKNTFDYYKYYRDNRNSSYKDDIIDFFASSFLQETVKIITKVLDTSGSASVANWLRRQQSQTDFFDVLSEEMAVNLSFQNMYNEFINKFSV